MSHINLTPEQWKTVRDVNREGNKLAWNPEVTLPWDWDERTPHLDSLSQDSGAARWKVDRLLQMGFDRSTVYHEMVDFGDEKHVVAIVDTPGGQYVLDNRFVQPNPKGSLPNYHFIFRSPDGQRWTAIR